MTAAEKILQKSLVGSGLNSAEWNLIQAGLRDRAFFSATVESVRVLSEARRLAAGVADGKLSASEFRRDMRKVLSMAGHPQGDGGITDLYAKRRLDLIRETNVRQARGYAQYMESTTDGALAAFPARELVRVRDRKKPRDWAEKWKAAGGRLYGGRMIALKTDPVWVAISRFGTPYPPFDYNSGMGVEEIDRAEALALGLIKKGDPPQHVERTGFNDGLTTSVTDMRSDSEEARQLRKCFGDQISILNSKVRWEGGILRDVMEGKAKKCSFGEATADFISKCPAGLGDQFRGIQVSLGRQFFSEHGDKHSQGKETRKDMIPMSPSDYELLPSLWRSPDKVSAVRGNRVEASIETFDGGEIVMVLDTGGIHSIQKRKNPAGTPSRLSP